MKGSDQTVCACPTCENMQFIVDSASLGCCAALISASLCENPNEIGKAAKCDKCPLKQDGFINTILPEKNVFYLKRWT